MLIGEFTSTKHELKNILLGICINNDNNIINEQCRDIISKDILEIKPSKLIHCYEIKELIKFLRDNIREGREVIAKEIIPNTYQMGIIRDMLFSQRDPETLIKKICKRFRYYFLMEVIDENKKLITVCLTYNPEINSLKKVQVRLDDNTTVTCTILQNGKQIPIVRDMEIAHKEENQSGELIVYKYESSINL